MKIIRKREQHSDITYSLEFRTLGAEKEFRGCGYGFDCDKDGNVNVANLPPAAQESYKRCLSGSEWRLVGVQYRWEPLHDSDDGSGHHVPILCTGEWKELPISKGEVVQHNNRWTTPAVGECNHCGKEVALYGFTNECECGALYNMSGQELSHPSNWGEETGEHPADLMRL